MRVHVNGQSNKIDEILLNIDRCVAHTSTDNNNKQQAHKFSIAQTLAHTTQIAKGKSTTNKVK